jgi:topoisomerase-4 subunit A
LSLERILSKTRSTAILRKTTREDVIKQLMMVKPHVKHLKRAVTEEDILRLLDIRIMRISSLTES